jgi:hypothetical protein
MARKSRGPRWGDAYIRTTEDGTIIHSQREYVGYGFTSYMIVGSFEGVSRVVDGIYRAYPPSGYGTHILWPPDAEKHKHLLDPEYMKGWSQFDRYAPYEQLNGNLWVLWCRHSESCE